MSMFGSFGNLFGSSGPALSADIGEPYGARSFGGWTHHRGTLKEDGSACSVFKFVGNVQSDRVRIETARNGAKRLKLTRHPNVVHLRESLEVEKGDELTIYVVTEAVMPLEEHLRDLSNVTHQRDEYFALGLRQVATAVSFLSNDCKLVHGGVSMAAVMVTERLDWKLGALDLLSELAAIGRGTLGEARLCHSSFVVPDQYKPEEYRRGDWASVPDGPPWAIDAWGLGCLIQEVYRGEPLMRTDQLRETDRIPQLLLKDYQRLLGSQPAKRYNPKKLVDNSALFANKLVETITFLDTLSLKDAIEKEQFFRNLPRVMESLAKAPVERKILPMICEALEFGSAPALALAPALHAARDVTPEDFAKKVTPSLVKLFNNSTDRALRVALLENLGAFAPHLGERLVEESVYDRVASGFVDEDAFLRELTLKSVLVLAPKLSQRAYQSLLKHLSKLQVDEEPAIRANTTILLGNVAGFLAEATARRVLLNAFSRALRDPFPPARQAGLMALTATTSYYDPGEIANRVLPAVAPLCVDQEAEVRDRAFACADVFVGMLKEHGERLKEGRVDAANAALAEARERARGAEKVKAEAAAKKAGMGVISWAVNAAGRAVGGGSSAAASPARGASATTGRRPRQRGGGGGGAGAWTSARARSRRTRRRRGCTDSRTRPRARRGRRPGRRPPSGEEETVGEEEGGGGAGPLGSSSSLGSRVAAASSDRRAAADEEDGDGWGDLEDGLEDEAEAAARARLSKLGGIGAARHSSRKTPRVGRRGGATTTTTAAAAISTRPPRPPRPPRPGVRRRRVRPRGRRRARLHRGRGARGVSGTRPKPAPMKLGAKKITAADIDLESMLG